MLRPRVLAGLLGPLVCTCAPPAAVAPPGPGPAQDLAAAAIAVDKPEGPAWLAPGLRALAHGAAVAGLTREPASGRVLVEIALQPGRDPRALDVGALAARGVGLRARASTQLDLWVPVDALPELAAWIPGLRRARPAARPHPTLGPVLGQGAVRTGADRLHCAGGTGQGVHVAVVDLGFGGWDQAAATGELAEVAGAVAGSDSVHGTACAEIVSDVAPGVVLHPVAVQTLTDLQAFVDTLPASPVQVISDSLVWTGESFGDGDGALCALATQARQAGALWVTSAGNHGHGTHYRAIFADQDGDGWHEVAAGDELNDLQLRAGSTLVAELDWDAYPVTDVDLDLVLFRQESTGPVQVAAASDPQRGAEAPVERLLFDVDISGRYGLAVVAVGGDPAGVALRLVLFPATELVLQVWQAEGSLLDPAPCADALAVGALPQADYPGGEVWRHSARGPTWDGRRKPDLVAPSEVRTSTLFPFSGTSAAAPHAAAAVALYAAAAGVDTWSAGQLVLADAWRPEDRAPDSTQGQGRLWLDATRAGWQCLADERGTCTTSCGTTGSARCGTACRWALCVAPPEQCNGRDDDCDGRVDEDCPTPGRSGCAATGHSAPGLLAGLALLLALARGAGRPGRASRRVRWTRSGMRRQRGPGHR